MTLRLSGKKIPQQILLHLRFNDLKITEGYDNSGSETSSEVGDTFHLQPAPVLFLDHRDENGDLLNVTYLGGDQSSMARVGSDTDLNFLLDASMMALNLW